jgi:hypothetical protein
MFTEIKYKIRLDDEDGDNYYAFKEILETIHQIQCEEEYWRITVETVKAGTTWTIETKHSELDTQEAQKRIKTVRELITDSFMKSATEKKHMETNISMKKFDDEKEAED